MTFPLPVDAYPPPSSAGLVATLGDRVAFEPFNAVATGVFALAVVHTFAAAKFTERAHHVQRAHEARARAAGVAPTPHVWAELLHFFGEVEVVFGLWAVVLLAAASVYHGWDAATSYVDEGVNYREPLFVGDHGLGIHAAGGAVCGECAAPGGQSRRRNARSLVALDRERRSAAGIVHH